MPRSDWFSTASRNMWNKSSFRGFSLWSCLFVFCPKHEYLLHCVEGRGLSPCSSAVLTCWSYRHLQQSSSLSNMEMSRGYCSWTSLASRGRSSRLPNISSSCKHHIVQSSKCEWLCVREKSRPAETTAAWTLKMCSRPGASSSAWQKTALSRLSVSSTVSRSFFTSSSYSWRAKRENSWVR